MDRLSPIERYIHFRKHFDFSQLDKDPAAAERGQRLFHAFENGIEAESGKLADKAQAAVAVSYATLEDCQEVIFHNRGFSSNYRAHKIARSESLPGTETQAVSMSGMEIQLVRALDNLPLVGSFTGRVENITKIAAAYAKATAFDREFQGANLNIDTLTTLLGRWGDVEDAAAQVMQQTGLNRQQLIDRIKNLKDIGGFIFTISDSAFDNYKVASMNGFEGRAFIETGEEGLPLNYLSGIKSLGAQESQFSFDLRNWYMDRARKI